MIASHVVILLVFSTLVSTVFAFLQRDEPKARVRFGLKVFAGFLLSTIVIGWLMLPLHRDRFDDQNRELPLVH